jgi:hypothetical protein
VERRDRRADCVRRAATHLFHAQIASLSVEQQPTGRPACTAEVVFMALAMVLARLTATGLQTARLPRTPIRAAYTPNVGETEGRMGELVRPFAA